jgi:preprotein translocase subunit SecE
MAENNKTKKRNAGKFFRETKSEVKKVCWPSKTQLFHNTAIILAFVIIMTVILFLFDKVFEFGFSSIIKR